MLVLDVADDLLDDVLEGDDAAQRAVLVDHDGEMLVPLAEGLELVEQDRRFGNEPRRRHDLVDLDPGRPAGGAHGAEQVLGVHHADHVVGLAAIERDAGVGRRQHLRHDRVGRLVGVDQHDVAAMGHDVADRAVAEIEDGAQHRLLGRRIGIREPAPCISIAPRSSSACSSASWVRSVVHADSPRKMRADPGDRARGGPSSAR